MNTPNPYSSDDLQWIVEFQSAQHSQLGNIRASGAKWAGGISALVGAFATLSVVLVPGKLSDLSSPVTRGAVAILAAITGICGLVALLLANRAAVGKPGLDSGADWKSYKLEVVTLAARAASNLQNSRRLVYAAIVAIVLAALVSQYDALFVKEPASVYVVAGTADGIGAGC